MSTKKIEENVGRKSLVMCINKGKTGNSLFLFWEGGKMFFPAWHREYWFGE